MCIRDSDFLDEVRSAGYDISKRSFNRYIEMVSAGGTGFSPSKMSGKKAALAEDERELLAGWLLCEVDAHRCVHLDDYRRASTTFFGVALSASTASRYLADDGFTYKSDQGKKGGFGLDETALVRLAWEWVDARQKRGVFKDPDRLCSIDFTYTSHRSNKPSSFAPIGGAQPKVDVHLTSYTNCIVTCVWADGRLPHPTGHLHVQPGVSARPPCDGATHRAGRASAMRASNGTTSSHIASSTWAPTRASIAPTATRVLS